MTEQPSDRSHEQFELIDRQTMLDGFFHVEHLKLRHTVRNSAWTPPLDRYLLRRPDAVCAVVYDRDRDALLLVRQFRVGTFMKDEGWMTELAAGLVDPGESPQDAVVREVREELGYQPLKLQPIRMVYTSPGIIDERIFLFYLEVDASSRVGDGGGNPHEHEDLEIIAVPANNLAAWMAHQDLLDAKTVIGIQWFLAFQASINPAIA